MVDPFEGNCKRNIPSVILRSQSSLPIQDIIHESVTAYPQNQGKRFDGAQIKKEKQRNTPKIKFLKTEQPKRNGVEIREQLLHHKSWINNNSFERPSS